jgi:hypothetical protein
MRRQTRNRSGDAPSGGPPTPAPTVPDPQEVTTASSFLTPDLAQEAIQDDAKTRRVNDMALVQVKIFRENLRTETDCQKELQESAAALKMSEFKTRMLYGGGVLVVVIAALFVFGSLHALDRIHGLAARYGVMGLTTVTGASVAGAIVAAVRKAQAFAAKARAIMGRLPFSGGRERDASARRDTETPHPPASRQD